MSQRIKSLEQMSEEELEDLLDDENITPALAKKITAILAQRREHTQYEHEREEEE